MDEPRPPAGSDVPQQCRPASRGSTHRPSSGYDLLKHAEAMVGVGDRDKGPHLVEMRADTGYFVGSTAPVLRMQLAQTVSGLYLPLSAAQALTPQPIHQIVAYLTAPEWAGRSMDFDEVLLRLNRVSLEHALAWTSHWLSRCHHPGMSAQDVDNEFIDTYTGDPERTRLRNLLRSGERVLVVPQGLTLLAKLAFFVCTSVGTPPPAAPDTDLANALLGLSEHMDAEFDEDEEELVVSGVPGNLGRSITANQMFNSNPDLLGSWAMFHRIWRELPYEEGADKSRIVDLAAVFEQATGVPLDDFVTGCALLWAAAMNGDGYVPMSAFDTFGWTPERRGRFLELVSADVTNMRSNLEEDLEKYGAQWSTRVFSWFPVIQWDDTFVTVLDAHLMAARATGIWPVLDILREGPGRDLRKLSNKAANCYRHLCEVYALEAIAGIVGTPVSSKPTRADDSTVRPIRARGRLYDDHPLRAAFPGKSKMVADAAVDYGHAWVVFEVTTIGLSAATVAGTADDSFMNDIDDYVDKCRQLHATIADLRADEGALTGVEPDGNPRRYHPVLTIAAPMCVNPIFMSLLRERLATDDILQNRDTAPIEVFEIVDLDAIEGLGEQGGPSLLQLLQGHRESGLQQMPMKDYIRLDRRLNPGKPKRVLTRSNTWTETMRRSMDQAG